MNEVFQLSSDALIKEDQAVMNPTVLISERGIRHLWCISWPCLRS